MSSFSGTNFLHVPKSQPWQVDALNLDISYQLEKLKEKN